MRTIKQQFTAARNAGTPLVGIRTFDQEATTLLLMAPLETEAPLFKWDLVQGMSPCNAKAEAGLMAMMHKLVSSVSDPGAMDPAKWLEESTMMNPVETLKICKKLPPDSVVFLANTHRFLSDAPVAQGILNLRTDFKGNGRMLVMTAPDFDLPAELKQDVFILEEELPDEYRLAKVVVDMLKDQNLKAPSTDDLSRAADLLKGLAEFRAEQTVAMAMTTKGLDMEALREMKRSAVEQYDGITMDREPLTFADMGGTEQAKEFGGRIMTGKCRPKAIFRIDEIDKMIAGAGAKDGMGDTSGVSQDAMGVFLKSMEDFRWKGMVLVGPGGSGKSLYAKTIGTTYGAPSFEVDFGATKAGIVGQSEGKIRDLMKVMHGIAGSDALIVATCNKLDSLPPELKRRFTYGIWFFDLPTLEEQRPIWDINMKRFGLEPQEFPDFEFWTGAEIRNCCELAANLSCSLVESSQYIVPIWKTDPASVLKLQDMAHGRFLSASYAGPYRKPSSEEKAVTTTPNRGRTIRLQQGE